MVQPAANGLRPSPRHGWLAAVIPASAQRFRVGDPELAAALSAAGAELVDRAPDVEIGTSARSAGHAPCAIVALRAREPTSRSRALRGAQRLGRAAVVRGRAGYAKWALRRRGYQSTRSLDWDRGTSIRLDGQQRDNVRALAHRFPLNAVVVGRRTDELTAFEAAVQSAERATGRESRLESLLVAASGVIVASGEEMVLRVGVGPAADRLDEQRSSLERLEQHRPAPVIADRVPRILAHGHAGLAVWSAERRLRGTRAPVRLADHLLADCLDFLVALHEFGSDGQPQSLARDADVIAAIASGRSADELRELGRHLDDRFAGFRRGFGHGDFWSGNLLVENGRLSGVVDWPSGGPGSLPLLDLLHLKATAARELSRRDLGPVIVEDLIGLMQVGGDEPIRDYCRRIGLEPEPALLVDLLMAYWLQELAHELLDPDRDPHKSAQERWREVNVEYVLRAFAQLRRPLSSTRAAARAVVRCRAERSC
jgi:aminoglycoside phosphotransferase (APT) family kinase protein